MSKMPSPADYLSRLAAVDWSQGDAYLRRWSRRALMREHLRRTALWMEELHSTYWPFPDLADDADPTLRAEPSSLEEMENLTAGVGGLVRLPCRNALHWYALQETDPDLPDLPDPYEPLMRFFERGGSFVLMTGYIDIYGGAMEKRNAEWYRACSPMTNFDEVELNRIDEIHGD